MLYPLSYGGNAARIVAEAYAFGRGCSLAGMTQALLIVRPLVPRCARPLAS